MTGALAVRATLSGSRLVISGNASISGALVVKNSALITGTMSGYAIYGRSFSGAGLVDCAASTNALRWTRATAQFSCGTISATSSFGTGNVITINGAYVPKSGGTMTGALKVRANLSGSSLNVDNLQNCTNVKTSAAGAFSCNITNYVVTAGRGLTLTSGVFTLNATITGSLVNFSTHSGGALHAERSLTSSGSLKVLGNMSGASLNVNNLKSCTNLQTNASGTFSCNGSTYQTTALSDDNVWVGSSGNLATATALPSCSTAGQSLQYNTSSNTFTCMTGFGSGNVLTINGSYVKKAGDTMTGALTVNLTTGFLGLKLINTESGNIIHAEKNLTSSGTLVIVGTTTLKGNATAPTQAASDNSTFVATTAYVTTAIANAVAAVNPAVAVQAATTKASDTSGLTYHAVAAGIGDTFTGTVNTAVTIDGYTFTAVGQRLLVKNDTQSPSGAFNGVYYVTQIQTGILAPVFTRALDYDQSSDINNTGAIPVVNGTVNASTSWLLTSSVTNVGTDPLTYVQFSFNPTTLVTKAGQGLTITTNSIALNPALTGSSLKIFGTASGYFIHAEKTVSSSGTIVSVGTITGKGTISGQTLIGSGGKDQLTATGNTIFNNVRYMWSSAQGAASTFLKNDGAGNLTWGTVSAGSPFTFTAKTTGYTAVSGDMVAADVTGGSWQLTLPAPTANSIVGVIMTKNNNTGQKTLTIKTPSATNIILDNHQGSGSVVSLTGSVVLYGTGDTLTFQADGTNWYPVTDHRQALTATMRRQAAQSVTNSTLTKISFDKVDVNIGQMADTTNNRINIRRSGNYLINTECSINNMSTNSQIDCDIYKNGAALHRQSWLMNSVTSFAGIGMLSVVEYLVKGDYIEQYVNQSGGTQNTQTGIDSPWLSVTEIR